MNSITKFFTLKSLQNERKYDELCSPLTNKRKVSHEIITLRNNYTALLKKQATRKENLTCRQYMYMNMKKKKLCPARQSID
jgi:hypothetical protein